MSYSTFPASPPPSPSRACPVHPVQSTKERKLLLEVSHSHRVARKKKKREKEDKRNWGGSAVACQNASKQTEETFFPKTNAFKPVLFSCLAWRFFLLPTRRRPDQSNSVVVGVSLSAWGPFCIALLKCAAAGTRDKPNSKRRCQSKQQFERSDDISHVGYATTTHEQRACAILACFL
jgi:hypothetical protein